MLKFIDFDSLWPKSLKFLCSSRRWVARFWALRCFAILENCRFNAVGNIEYIFQGGDLWNGLLLFQEESEENSGLSQTRYKYFYWNIPNASKYLNIFYMSQELWNIPCKRIPLRAKFLTRKITLPFTLNVSQCFLGFLIFYLLIIKFTVENFAWTGPAC